MNVCVCVLNWMRVEQKSTAKIKKSVAYIAAHSQCGGRGVYAINHERIQFRQNVKAPSIVKSISVCVSVCLCVGDCVRAAVCVCVVFMCGLLGLWTMAERRQGLAQHSGYCVVRPSLRTSCLNRLKSLLEFSRFPLATASCLFGICCAKITLIKIDKSCEKFVNSNYKHTACSNKQTTCPCSTHTTKLLAISQANNLK